jgi:hypothetical protein
MLISGSTWIDDDDNNMHGPKPRVQGVRVRAGRTWVHALREGVQGEVRRTRTHGSCVPRISSRALFASCDPRSTRTTEPAGTALGSVGECVCHAHIPPIFRVAVLIQWRGTRTYSTCAVPSPRTTRQAVYVMCTRVSNSTAREYNTKGETTSII